MENENVVEINNLSKKFCKNLRQSIKYGINNVAKGMFGIKSYTNELLENEFWALKDINFSIKKGDAIGIIGKNGSGKSTLLKILNGIYSPDIGDITIKGKVSSLIEVGAGFHPLLSGRENISVYCSILGMTRAEIKNSFDSIVDFSEIGDFLDMSVKNYSSGMFVRLGFSCAISVEPDILIIDEALAVGDIYFQQKCYRKIKSLLDSGTTIILVSHDMLAVKNLCSFTHLLDKGTLVASGEPTDILNHYNALQMISVGEDYKVVSEKKAESEDIQYRYGNSYIQIKEVFLKTDGGIVTGIVSGQLGEFVVVLHVYQEIENPTVGILIKDRLGNDIFGVNTYFLDKHFGVLKPGTILEIEFKGYINIGEGEYTLSVACHEGPTHTVDCYDWLDKALIFQVFHEVNYKFSGYARIEMNCQYNLTH